MHFSARTITTLEFDKITELLSEMAATEGAAAKARSLMPSDDFDVILTRQRRTDDAKRLINAKGYPIKTWIPSQRFPRMPSSP